jgi:uncharacterized protein YecT (DUF1311 family)
LIMAGLLAASALAAGPTTTFASEAAQTDQELNQTYQQVMQMLPVPAREQLRKSERAWLTFTQLNNAAFQATASRLGLSPAEVERIEVDHVRLRVRELREMLGGGDSGAAALARSQSEDGRLNIVYQRCISALTAAEVMKLRQAQRAWISFRDASRPLGADVCWRITSDRIDQLNNFYIGSGGSSVQASPPKTAAPRSEGGPDPSIPDPFERAQP